MRRVFLILVSLLVGGSSGLLSAPGKPLPSLRRVISTQKQLAAAISGAEGGSVDATDARGGGLATVQGSSLPQSIGNLIKNIVGAGVLSLPAGVAAFSDCPGKALPLALSLTLAIAAMSGYCFMTIGEVCAETGEGTYAGAFHKATGQPGKLVEIACTLKTGMASLCYSIIIGDLARDLAVSAGLSASRNALLAGISVTTLLPLCLARSLAVLAPFSLLGVIGTLGTALFMGQRLFTGAYALPSGRFATLQPFVPSFCAGQSRSLPVFVLISMLSTTFIAHFNAPRFKHELRDSTTSRFATLTVAAFGGAALLCGSMMAFGACTFGGSASGLVLNNYATADGLAGLARGGIFASVMFSYPLAFSALRDGLFRAFGKSPSQSTSDIFTVALLTGITGVAMVLRDLGFLVAFGGAVLGSLIAYVFPTMMHLGMKAPKVAAGTATPAEKRGVLINRAMLGVGSGLGIIGAIVSVLKSFTAVFSK